VHELNLDFEHKGVCNSQPAQVYCKINNVRIIFATLAKLFRPQPKLTETFKLTGTSLNSPETSQAQMILKKEVVAYGGKILLFQNQTHVLPKKRR